jgi:hypothetical protein
MAQGRNTACNCITRPQQRNRVQTKSGALWATLLLAALAFIPTVAMATRPMSAIFQVISMRMVRPPDLGGLRSGRSGIFLFVDATIMARAAMRFVTCVTRAEQRHKGLGRGYCRPNWVVRCE